MYRMISKKLADYILINKSGKDEFRKVYEYGFECLLSIICNVFIVLFVGVITDYKMELIIYMIFYTLLRINAGGIHLNTHFKCIIFYISMALVSIHFIFILCKSQFYSFALGLLLGISILLVFLFAPVQSPNKPLDSGIIQVLRRKSRMTVIFECIIIMFFVYVLGINRIVVSAISGVFIQSTLLIPNSVRKEIK